MKPYPFWSFLSISALDAPMISVAWYIYFVEKSQIADLNMQYCLILGCSVWLGYMADRLFDIEFKKEAKFISLRHLFCKQYKPYLWALWAIILISTLIFSLDTLNNDKIVVGFILILIILLYNFLNQYFTKKKFPKEVFIAAIFAYGTLFLIQGPMNLSYLFNFCLICFLNCLIINHKEKKIDQLMGVTSLTHLFSHRFILIIISLSCAYYLISFQSLLNPFSIICLINLALHATSKHIDAEHFRVITETSYILVALIAVMLLKINL